MDFKNKHAIVTGGANGIGRCIAEAFLREGALVSVIDVDDTAGNFLQTKHKKLHFYWGDLAEKKALVQFVDSLSRQPVNCVINNACLGNGGILSDCSYEDFEYVQRVGVTAPYYLVSLLLQRHFLSPGASIVNISSTRANQSQPDTEAYSATKGGISALTHAMAISLAGKARVNAINPGWIETASYHTKADIAQGQAVSQAPPNPSDPDNRQHPAGRTGKPEDIVEMVLYLCSPKAGFITGESITIDGGMSRLMVYHNDHGWKLV